MLTFTKASFANPSKLFLFSDQITEDLITWRSILQTGYCWWCMDTFLRLHLSSLLLPECPHISEWANDTCRSLSRGLIWLSIRIPPATSRDSWIPLPHWNTFCKSENILAGMYAPPHWCFLEVPICYLVRKVTVLYARWHGIAAATCALHTYQDCGQNQIGRNQRLALHSLGTHHYLAKILPPWVRRGEVGGNLEAKRLCQPLLPKALISEVIFGHWFLCGGTNGGSKPSSLCLKGRWPASTLGLETSHRFEDDSYTRGTIRSFGRGRGFPWLGDIQDWEWASSAWPWLFDRHIREAMFHSFWYSYISRGGICEKMRPGRLY